MVSFEIESWIWYAVVLVLALSRFLSRRIALGTFKSFQADDYIMACALAFYTTLIVTINIVAVTNSNLLPPGYDVDHMTQDDIDERTYGSKLILVVEECQCTVVWAAKACLLIMYLRLTSVRRENIAVKILAGYVAGSFVVMEVLYLGVWCRPFYDYWAVPTPNVQCDAATNHLITNAVLNLSSDIAMLVVGLPMFIRMHLPLRKKIPVVGVFSLGIFVIISSILNKVYSFTNPFGDQWVFWYVRESSTALIVANLPFVWLLYRRLFCIPADTKQYSIEHNFSETPSPLDSRRRTGAFSPTGSRMVAGSASGSGNRVSGRMTLEEMLRAEDASASETRKNTEINQLTHPALFYASLKQMRPTHDSSPTSMEAAVHPWRSRSEATDEVELVSGGPSTNHSSTTSNNRRSVGSFV